VHVVWALRVGIPSPCLVGCRAASRRRGQAASPSPQLAITTAGPKGWDGPNGWDGPIGDCGQRQAWRTSPPTSRRAAASTVPLSSDHRQVRSGHRQLGGGFMVVPLLARSVAAAAGALLVLTAASSVIGTLIVPRPVTSLLTRWVDRIVNGGYRLATAGITDYKRRDPVLATQAAAILLMQLIVWLGIFFVGYSLLMWPLVDGGITQAFTTAGPALWEIGSVKVGGAAERTILDIASLTGIVTVTLQIAYLPTLYSAFNRRETEIALLNARASVPSWGPELLARTHYALGSGVSTIDTLPDL